MKQVMMVKFDSPKWRKVDEYKVANPFVDVGFRQVKDVVDLRVFDLLNISRINNNRAEEMLLCIYHLLQPTDGSTKVFITMRLTSISRIGNGKRNTSL